MSLTTAIAAFGGAVETRSNGEVKVRCPICGHRSLWLTDEPPVMGWCESCLNAGKKDAVNAAVREASGTEGYTPIVNTTVKKEPKEKKETPIRPEWDKWVPLTEKTYQIIKRARQARNSYMPKRETLVQLGVRETPGKSGAPHATVGFPNSLGDRLATSTPVFAEPSDLVHVVDNLKVLLNAGFDGNKAEWRQWGPNRQDVVFGLARYQPGGISFQPPPTKSPAFFPSSGETRLNGDGHPETDSVRVPELVNGVWTLGTAMARQEPATPSDNWAGQVNPAPAPSPRFNYTDSLTFIDEVWLVEGQWDAACLIEHGYNAWAILVAGQNDLHPSLWKLLEQARRIYIIRDADAGREISFSKMLDKFPQVYTRIVPLPEGFKDVCALRYRTDAESFRRILAACTQNQAIEIRERVSDVDNTAVADLSTKDAPEGMLDGRLGELCRNHLLQDLPIAWAWLALVSCASVLVPNSENNVINTGLFTALVGPAGTGKGQAIKRSCELLGIRYNGFKPGSGEALGAWLVPDNASYLPPDEAPRFVLMPDEIAHLLGKAGAERASLPFVLSTLYDQDRDTLKTIKLETRIHGRLSLIGGLAPDLFGNAFGAESIGGLYDRFSFGAQPTNFRMDYTPFERPAVEIPKCRMVSVDRNVWEAKSAWLRTKDRHFQDTMQRVVQNGLRFALVCAAFDGRPTLKGEDLNPTWEFVEYQYKMRQIYKPNAGESNNGKLTLLLKDYIDHNSANGEWLVLRDVFNNTNAYKFGVADAQRVIDTFVANGYLERRPGRQKNSVFIRKAPVE